MGLTSIRKTLQPDRRSYGIALLAFTWLVMQIFFLWQNGIKTDLEASKYIFEAEHFLSTGTYSSGNFLFYSIEIMLIAFCMKMHIGYWFVVLIQILVNGLSVICFYKIAGRISKNHLLPFMATFYFLLLFYYHVFNTFLFTESLFFSLSVIYTNLLFSLKKLTLLRSIWILLLLTLLYFTRPTGIFFLPATYLFFVIRFFPQKAFKITILSAIIGGAALFYLLNYALKSGGEYDFLLPYSKEMILCGVPTISIPVDLKVPVEKNSIQGLFYIVTHYFGLFAQLSIKRLSAFYGVSRTFYSLFHNIYVSVYFYTLYLLILVNVRYLLARWKAEVWFLLINISLMTLTVMLSCDEWGNRFIFSITPFFLILAVIGLHNRRHQNDRA